MEIDLQWLIPLLFAASGLATLTFERGRWNQISGLVMLTVAALLVVMSGALDGSWPPPLFWWAVVILAALLVPRLVDIRRTGADVLLDQYRREPRTWQAARLRGRVERALRGPVPADRTSAMDGHGPTALLTTGALDTGRGDPGAAADRIDAVLLPRDGSVVPRDAVLGLLLWHRTTYAALAAAAGDRPGEPERRRDDLDLARVLLPDVRLGWLAAAAVALAEGRRNAALAGAERLLRTPRGRWERGLAAVVARAATGPDDPHRTARLDQVLDREDWVQGLRARLVGHGAGTIVG